MNWIPGTPACLTNMAGWPARIALAVVLTGATAAADDDPPTYRVDYIATPLPASATIEMEMRLTQPAYLLREVRFDLDDRISLLDGDGELQVDSGVATWRPPRAGGSLRWTVTVAHRRNGDGFDAYLGSEWGLFRAEDIVPRAATRTRRGAVSDTRLSFRLPDEWSAVTEYFNRDGTFTVDNPFRRFDQPTGWIVLGELGVRRDRIAGVRVAVAGPMSNDVRRMDILALLNWTLPELSRLVPEMPPRLTIVSAGDPMWRGGLSAPGSMFVHADRPLVSENGTSTLLHEVMHVVLTFETDAGFDWLVEGLAEYYSLELLRRSGTLSARRHARTIESLADWAQDADVLCAPHSSGPITARAVLLFRDLDRELRERAAGEAGLDMIVAAIANTNQVVTVERLNEIVVDLTGSESDVIGIDKLPGCRKMAAASKGR